MEPSAPNLDLGTVPVPCCSREVVLAYVDPALELVATAAMHSEAGGFGWRKVGGGAKQPAGMPEPCGEVEPNVGSANAGGVKHRERLCEDIGDGVAELVESLTAGSVSAAPWPLLLVVCLRYTRARTPAFRAKLARSRPWILTPSGPRPNRPRRLARGRCADPGGSGPDGLREAPPLRGLKSKVGPFGPSRCLHLCSHLENSADYTHLRC